MRAVLIGGSSHAGKSTVAELVAKQLGGRLLSTDTLARHPGRPWSTPQRAVPDHVAAHYASLSPDALLADVLRHYADNVWPLVLNHLRTAAASGECLIVEGSALWPDLVATLKPDGVHAFYLTSDDPVFTDRMKSNSGYADRTPDERLLIDKFLARTLLYDLCMREAAGRHGFRCINVPTGTSSQAAADEIIQACGLDDPSW